MAQAPTRLDEKQFKKAGHQEIDGEKLKKMLLGNTAYVIRLKASADGKSDADEVVAYYWKDESKVLERQTAIYTGKPAISHWAWWMDGNRMCRKGAVQIRGRAVPNVTCWNVYDLGSTLYGCTDGRCDQLIRLVPGNPEKF